MHKTLIINIVFATKKCLYVPIRFVQTREAVTQPVNIDSTDNHSLSNLNFNSK